MRPFTITLLLVLLPIISAAQTCETSYCHEGVYYSDCYYSIAMGCECSNQQPCEYGCNQDATACATSPGQDCPPSYCEGVNYYSGCYWDAQHGFCNCPTSYGCPNGCNLNGTACAPSTNTTDPRCPQQCYEGILHYNGRYIESMQSCTDESRQCPSGQCLSNHSDCAPVSTPTPTPTSTPVPTPVLTPTSTPSPTPQPTATPTTSPTIAPTPSPTSQSPLCSHDSDCPPRDTCVNGVCTPVEATPGVCPSSVGLVFLLALLAVKK